MRLIVLDTNVLISARINSEGTPSTIIEMVLDGRIQVVTSPKISEEYREVASRAKFHRYGFPPVWLGTLIRSSLILSDPEPWPFGCPDLKDSIFLAVAHAAGAWLVTGNLKHFPEMIRNGVTVVSPSDYLTHITTLRH